MDGFSLGSTVPRFSTHSASINKLKNLLSPLVSTAPTGKSFVSVPDQSIIFQTRLPDHRAIKVLCVAWAVLTAFCCFR